MAFNIILLTENSILRLKKPHTVLAMSICLLCIDLQSPHVLVKFEIIRLGKKWLFKHSIIERKRLNLWLHDMRHTALTFLILFDSNEASACRVQHPKNCLDVGLIKEAWVVHFGGSGLL